MTNPEASFLPGDISMKSLHRAFPSLSQKLDLHRQLGAIKGDLEIIEERLRFQVQEFDPGISGYVSYAIESNGKRIRPALVLLAAHATGKSTPQHLDLAVALELIHLATLVHDDIMDGATQRRGKPTASAKWGAELSVLLGDCLFCHALKLSTGFPDQSISRKIAEASNEVCSGEILQTQRRFDLKLTIPEYIKIIAMKTAALFRICTELAAVLNNCRPDEVQALRNYGDYLGIAYQIYDDCLDLVGTEGATGKTVGTDLAKGKLTLPLLHVLAQANDAERERLHSTILHGSEENRLLLLSQVVERGGLKNAVRRIQTYLDQAVASLQVLPKTKYRETLEGLPRAVAEHVATLA
ncbi:MAG: polyprenyl synthetase family protein [Methylacidiphilales bacterium]|nr:polyprenyl synthetase family protein [Candidatus Methylacidiphilales bacterium]